MVELLISEDSRKILGLLPSDGSLMGNISLMRELNMSPDRFYVAKTELDAKGLIIYGRGKGGSTGLAKPSEQITRKPPTSGIKDEFEMYGPLKKYFDDYWGPNYKSPDVFISKITGPPKDHKRKSGLWSRPDVSILTIAGYDFIPEQVLELTTVEAKRYDEIGPRAVFETVSHSKFGHQAYLAIEWLDETDIDDSPDENMKEVVREAQRFGIGLIQMKKSEPNKWKCEIVLDPQRREPDPVDCNRFIEQNFVEHHKTIRRAIGH